MNIRTFVAVSFEGASHPEYDEFDSADIANFLVAPGWKYPFPYSIFGLQVEGGRVTGILFGGTDPAVARGFATDQGRSIIQYGYQFIVGRPLSEITTPNPHITGLLAFIHEETRQENVREFDVVNGL